MPSPMLFSNLSMPRFLLGFDHLMNFNGEKRKLVLTGGESVEGMIRLRDELVPAMHRIGFHDRRVNPTPHVTLNYHHCRVQEERIEPIRWTVEEIVLVCSLNGRHRHVCLGCWPLRTGSWLN